MPIDKRWQVGPYLLDLDRVHLMGVLNVTPDSFYDGGRYATVERALERAQQMVEEGASIIDVGGESSRPAGPYGPGAETVSADEEIARTSPVVEAIADRLPVPVSIDTVKTSVAEAALDRGACIVNDISAASNPAMRSIVAQYKAGCVLMHMQGTPKTMQSNPRYDDLIGEVRSFLQAAVQRCVEAGIPKEALAIDPGFGFGKNRGHNLELLGRLDAFSSIGLPLLVGLSRKTFVDPDAAPEDRLAGSIAGATLAVSGGANILRVHDVGPTARSARLAQAVLKRRSI